MTVEDPSVIDQVTRSKDGSVYTLDMVEIRSFGLVDEQLEQITNKINRYVELIQTGEVYEHVPEARGRRLNVAFVCIDDPAGHPRLVELLETATALFAEHGVAFSVRVMPPESAGLRRGWDRQRAAMRDRLRSAGVPDDLYEIEGVNKARPGLESYYFLAGRPAG